MESFNAMSRLTFRTLCLTLNRAAAFARCLSGNPRFDEVEIIESKRARGENRWIVRYLPRNPDRQQAMLDRQQDARTERGHSEAFTFVADCDHPFYHCLSHASGEVYGVSAHGCDCGDAYYRLRGTGLRCKHQVALLLALERGEVAEFEPVPPRPVDRRAEQDEFTRIFG
jgi:hypothetical protein